MPGDKNAKKVEEKMSEIFFSRVTPFPFLVCWRVVAVSGCHIFLILRTIEGRAIAPSEEKLDSLPEERAAREEECQTKVYVQNSALVIESSVSYAVMQL